MLNFAIREMQIKSTMRYHLTPVRIATINRTSKANFGEDVEKLLVGLQIGIANMENSMEVPQKN